MRYRWDKKYLYWGVTAFLVIAAGLLAFALIFRFQILLDFFGTILNVMTPLFYGLIIAFLVDPIVRFCERCFRRIFKKRVLAIKGNPVKQARQKKRVRAISILIALAVALGIVTGLLFLVIPQIINSLGQMVDNFSGYYRNFTNWINDTLQSDSQIGSILKSIVGEGFSRITSLLEKTVMPQAENFLTNITSGLIGFVGTLQDLIMGFIISIFFLYHKEKFIAHLKMFLYSFIRKKWANSIIGLGQDVNKYFGGFLTGKILDSAIIGVLCFIVMSIFQFDYSLLISVIVGVTNIIPFFGPFIGAIPSAFFLLMIDPWECIYFLIWILILQQLDGNVIGPLVLGNRTGVSGFWVITSIAVFGGLFNIIGIIVAVPLCAVILVLVKRRIRSGLLRRKMDYDTAVYMHAGTIYENDDVLNTEDDHFTKPIKSAEVQRPIEAHEHVQQGQLTVLTKRLIRYVKKKRNERKR